MKKVTLSLSDYKKLVNSTFPATEKKSLRDLDKIALWINPEYITAQALDGILAMSTRIKRDNPEVTPFVAVIPAEKFDFQKGECGAVTISAEPVGDKRTRTIVDVETNLRKYKAVNDFENKALLATQDTRSFAPTGKAHEIAFDVALLKKALTAVGLAQESKGAKVVLQVRGELDALVLRSVDDENDFQALVMPIRRNHK